MSRNGSLDEHVGNGVSDESEPSSDASDRELLLEMRRDIRQIRSDVQVVEIRIDKIEPQLADIRGAVKDVAADARVAREQATRVETTYDADIGARAGRGDALTTDLVQAAVRHLKASQADAVDAKKDWRKGALQIVVLILTAIAAAMGGAKLGGQ